MSLQLTKLNQLRFDISHNSKYDVVLRIAALSIRRPLDALFSTLNSKMEKFRQVDSHNGFSVGDVIHIKRWYYAEGTEDFQKSNNCIMLDVEHAIEKITIDDETGCDILWCGKFSTSTTDVANKGLVIPA